ncbi:MAG: hypothetical protein ABR575_05070 [Actinomycetota bacterium]
MREQQARGGERSGVAERRQAELRTFALIGLVPDPVMEVIELFRTGDRSQLSAALQEEAGLPWVRSFESAWEIDPTAARRSGLFDLLWHRRARDVDPIITARNFAGFDVLLDAARRAAPDLAVLLAGIDPNDPVNPRVADGPAWCRAWHEAAATHPGGWLAGDEVRALCEGWWKLTGGDLEQICVETMGATYTHPGCWTLLSELGGFFSQCVSEGRSVVVEVDL